MPASPTRAAVATIKRIESSPAFAKAMAAIDSGHDKWVADIITLTEIPAPPYKETARAQAYRDMFIAQGLTDVEIDAVGNVTGLRKGGGEVGMRGKMDRSPAQAGGRFQILGQIVNKKRALRFGFGGGQGGCINIRVGLSGSHMVGIDPGREQGEKIVGILEMADMGSAGVGNESQAVMLGQGSGDCNTLGKGVENITKGFPKFGLGVGEIEFLG